MNKMADCWPTAEQELLLRAALLRGEDAVVAWEKWKSGVDIEQLDPGSHNLLPLLYDNLNTLGIKDPVMSKLKGVYRQTWYKNQLSIHRIAALITAFHNAGIETMVLKGAALTLLYYRNHGLRPMGDIDILVHTEQAREAIDWMIKSGWIPEYKSPESVIPLSHGVAFRSPTTDQAIDLHWHVLHEGRQENADDKFWEGAVSVKISNVPTYSLNPTDQLLHTFVHGIKWNPVPPFRWVADSMTVINTTTSIDWERLLIQTKAYRLIPPVRDGLDYLRRKLDAAIPEAVLRTLQNMPTSKMERIEYSYKTQNYELKPLGYLPVLWFDYSRLAGNKPLPIKIFGFVKYLQLFWGAEGLRHVPLYAISMTIRKMHMIADYYGKLSK